MTDTLHRLILVWASGFLAGVVDIDGSFRPIEIASAVLAALRNITPSGEETR